MAWTLNTLKKQIQKISKIEQNIKQNNQGKKCYLIYFSYKFKAI